MLFRSPVALAFISLAAAAGEPARVDQALEGPSVTVTLIKSMAPGKPTHTTLLWLVEPAEGSSGFVSGGEPTLEVGGKTVSPASTREESAAAYATKHPGVLPPRAYRPTARVVEVVVATRPPLGAVATLEIGAWKPGSLGEGASGAKPQLATFRVRL